MSAQMVHELAPILTALALFLTPSGTAIVWIWRRVEKRIASAEAKADKCEQRERHTSAVVAALVLRQHRGDEIVAALVAEVRRLDPKSQALKRVAAMLKTAIPLPDDLPDDMRVLIESLTSGPMNVDYEGGQQT